MKEGLIGYLICPECGGKVTILKQSRRHNEIEDGIIGCTTCNANWPIKNYIPRFVNNENYAASFGFQWNKHKRVQLDSATGLKISHDRFYSSTKWPNYLSGSLILEAGCGAGRFTEIALKSGAEVVSFDYSTSVDACLENVGLRKNFHIVQSDIYRLPFRKELFDRLFCFGVLQHTPNVEKAFSDLLPVLKRGGDIAIDVYSKSSWLLWRVKYKLRPCTKRINKKLLYFIMKQIIPSGLKLKIKLSESRSRKMQKIGEAIPVLNYKDSYPLSDEQLIEWALLDTFDMFSPEYDQPQDIEDVKEWFSKAMLSDVEVEFGGNGIVGRAVKL